MSKHLFGLLLTYALAVPLLFDAGQASFASALQPPSSAHIFGTDHFGFDLFVRTAASLRVSLVVGLASALGATVLGAMLGLLAATLGGITDRVMMRLTDAVNAIPHLILSVVIVAMFKGSLLALVIAIAATHWTQVARVVRATVLSVRTSEYVAASYQAGGSRWWVLRKHLAPAAGSQCTVAVMMLMPHAVWHESALSFLGLGVQANEASLGTLLELARADVTTGAWWTLVFPAAVLLATTLSGVALIPRNLAREQWQLRISSSKECSAHELRVSVGEDVLLDGICFQVVPGTIHALIGASGSGKSTLGRALAGVFPRDAIVTGVVQAGAAYIPQSPAQSFTPVRRIGSQLAEVLSAHNSRQTVAQLLQRVHLTPDVAQLFPHQLSGGMAARVAIAAALAMEPTYLVADEPTSALDPELTASIMRLLRELADAGLGIALITHDIAELESIADKISVVYRGNIVETGEQVLRSPQHPYTAELVRGL